MRQRIEDMDVAELERRARVLGDVFDRLQSWASAANHTLVLLFGLTVARGGYDVWTGRPPWPVLTTYAFCYAFFYVMAEVFYRAAKYVLRGMRQYVDRRQELVDQQRAQS